MDRTGASFLARGTAPRDGRRSRGFAAASPNFSPIVSSMGGEDSTSMSLSGLDGTPMTAMSSANGVGRGGIDWAAAAAVRQGG